MLYRPALLIGERSRGPGSAPVDSGSSGRTPRLESRPNRTGDFVEGGNLARTRTKTTNHYDQASRYLAKLDPLGWLLPRLTDDWEFHDRLDTRTIPFPGEPDRVCDSGGPWPKQNRTPGGGAITAAWRWCSPNWPAVSPPGRKR